MHKTNNLFLIFFFLIHQLVSAQQKSSFKIHSHNDYMQNVPFWSAYANGLNSIEADVFLRNDTLFVAHGEKEIKKGHTIESLYLEPIQQAMQLRLGNAQNLQLLVDIKSEPYSTLKNLISALERYPHIIENEGISVVISGNRPSEIEYVNYPDYIKFDYQRLDDLSNEKTWEKVALISLNFGEFSLWNGKGRLTKEDQNTIEKVIDQAHNYGKPFRFWGTPDSKTAWKAFKDLGIDFINTDFPYESSKYLNTLKDRFYKNTISSDAYTPTYNSDQKDIPAKNVILLIGDGNGLTQISSATLANGGNLTLTQLKSIGFLKTQSADDFTTDSAAAGTALATGKKTNNRAIGVDNLGEPLQNITELLSNHDFVSGLITTDMITGATPASFYAHQKDRSDVSGIAEDLWQSKLSLFVGGGAQIFQNNQDFNGFTIIDRLEDFDKNENVKVGFFMSENEVPSIIEGRGAVLADATRNGLAFLQSKNKPFFLMVEGAKIDSYGHENDVAGIVSEGIDFDRAITEAIKFADKNGNTLVIVTADHETSGFSIPQGNLVNKAIEGDFTTHDHTGTMVPIFAYGPHSQEFQGVYENSEVFLKILKVLNLKRQQN